MAEYGSYAQQRPKLIAGARCLDFLNTTEDGRTERLTGYSEFAIWSRAAGLIDARGERRLLALAAKQPPAAARALGLVLEARQALTDLLAGPVRRRTPAMRVINRILAQDRFVLQLEFGTAGVREHWAPDCPELRRPLFVLLREAVALVSSPVRPQIHHCANDDCRWFFVDTSRNQSRRWCEMETCGNQAKARAHYRRQRASG
jgi:predicted RNA-binding Zn ribbon-like protein